MANYKKEKLIGGTRDGEIAEVLASPGWIQPIIYIARKLSFDEVNSLIINENTTWRHPEDVYVRNKDGEYIFMRTQHYDPNNAVFNSQIKAQSK